MALKLPQLIGHRGAASYAPENTLESIRTAADMGATWVELDVKLTKDQIPIIFHDDDLDRTSNGSGPVMLRTYEEISQFEAGSWFGDSFSGIKIPTLDEAAELIMELGLGLNLEIKPCPGREKETAEVALDYLSRMWDDHDKLLISSFSQVSLEAARDIAGDWKRGLLIDGDLPENWRELADYLDATTLNIGDKYTTREVVEEIMNEDYPIAVWTINDPNRARELLRWGVDSMFTDMPDLLEETLRKVH